MFDKYFKSGNRQKSMDNTNSPYLSFREGKHRQSLIFSGI